MGVTSSLKTWSSQAIFGMVMIGYPLEPAGKGWLITPLKNTAAGQAFPKPAQADQTGKSAEIESGDPLLLLPLGLLA